MSAPQILSVEQVLEMQPGDESWVNGDIRARVIAIENKTGKPPGNKKFWKIELGSDTSGARIFMTVFMAPRFGPGSLIDITGKGIKRSQFNGDDEIKIGNKVEIHLVEAAGNRPPPPQQTPPPARTAQDDQRGGAPPPREHQETLPGTETAANTFPMEGQTVGMVMKEARELVQYTLGENLTEESLDQPEIYALIWRVASALAKISNKLKKGNLAPFPGSASRPAPASAPAPAPTPPPAPPPAAPPPRSNPPPPPRRPVDDEDVPF